MQSDPDLYPVIAIEHPEPAVLSKLPEQDLLGASLDPLPGHPGPVLALQEELGSFDGLRLRAQHHPQGNLGVTGVGGHLVGPWPGHDVPVEHHLGAVRPQQDGGLSIRPIPRVGLAAERGPEQAAARRGLDRPLDDIVQPQETSGENRPRGPVELLRRADFDGAILFVSHNLGLIAEHVPLLIGLAAALMLIKFAVLYLIGRLAGCGGDAARNLGITLAAGGE